MDSSQGDAGSVSYGSVQNMSVRPDLFESCDWSMGADKEKQYRHELKNSNPSNKKVQGRFGAFMSNALYAGQSWIAIALVGILTGTIAGMMQIFKAWLFDFRLGTCMSKGFWYSKYECCQDEPDFNSCKEFVTWGLLFSENMFIRTVLDRFFYTLFSVLMVALSAYLVKTLCPLAKGSGIPELKTILGGFMSARLLSLTMLLVKVCALLLAVGGGLCVGMESCFIHIAGCISFVVSGFFSKFRFSDAKFRELLTCACAAGISVAFGAPIGGVLFAYETLSSYFPPKTLWRSFFCAIVAELALKLTDPLHQGTLTIFEVTYHSNFKWFEMLPFAFLGMIGGVVGSAILKCIKRYGTLRKTHRISEHPIIEAVFVTVLTAVSSYSFLYAREDSTLLIAGLYDDCRISGIRAVRDLCDADATPVIMFSLSVVIVLKFVGLVLASNLAVPGGHFVPCLVIGACIGRIFGTVVAIVHMHMGDFGFFWECRDVPICVVPGVYAIIGSAAVMTGVTRATLSVVVIIFEITGGLEYIPPTM
jgi:chloride channel 3/4/5